VRHRTYNYIDIKNKKTKKELQLFLYQFVNYIISIHAGKGLPTYCATRAVGWKPLATNDKQSNQWTLKKAVNPILINFKRYQGKGKIAILPHP